MYERINERLSQARQNMFRLQKIEAMLVSLQNELYGLEEKAQSVKSELDKENRDYEKISKKSVSALFYTILGSLEEQTEKERQEALKAQLKYDQTIRDMEDARYQISKLETERHQYQDAQAEYDTLYREKSQLLMQENSRTAQKIMELGERIERSQNNLREIGEAISAGNDVLNSLADTSESLDSAEGWGMWDMFGGGLITDMIKHSHIDDASGAAQRTQSLLRRFRTELADVRITEEIHIDISGFAKFADFFFDGLFADWFIQSKINTSQESVRTVLHQVQSVQQRLGELESAEQRAQIDLQAQIDKLIIEA